LKAEQCNNRKSYYHRLQIYFDANPVV